MNDSALSPPDPKFLQRPWNKQTFISLLGMPLPPLFLVKDGWKEAEHDDITQLKKQIESFSSHEVWEISKKITNPFEAIFSSDEAFPSLSLLHEPPLSRSYFKMIEMLKVAGIHEKKNITAHVCEGPGGFIQAVIQKLNPTAVYAMTLKPSKPQIPGWKKSSYFLRNHSEIRLEYGQDGTGNICSLENQISFAKKAKGASLFTADGGFDFSIDYSKQECSVFPLLLSSFTLGFQTLAKGGTMIIKLFDMYSPLTQDLLIGCASFFSDFMIYKPATSRPCNSERYFIGRGFLGEQAATVKLWIQFLQSLHLNFKSQESYTRLFGYTSWPSPITQAFQEQIEFQESLQMKCITETFQLKKDDIFRYIQANLEMSDEWCRTFMA
jgi:23S rRNA U2552 (ribose-2'-O)-methylase RlmE/FtsJ